MARKSKEINGHTYYLSKEGVTKAEAERHANWMRRGGFKARIEKIGRGNYNVWSG